MMQRDRARDFAIERRLCHLNAALHKRFTDTVFALQYNLSNYKLIFPEYTDHSNLHSLTVIRFCNALIGDRLGLLNADEIDVAAERNPILLYDLEALTDEKQIMENKKLKAVHSLRVTEKRFILTVDPVEEDVLRQIERVAEKMKETLDDCRAALRGRTPYVITQEEVVIEKA